MINRFRTTDTEPSHRSLRDWLTTGLDWLVAFVGLVLLGVGAVLLLLYGDVLGGVYLALGGLLLVADKGATLDLRVGRLEGWARDTEDGP